MDLGIEQRLRSAAKSATRERRVAGGLLYGRGWTDDQGSYVVVDGFLEAGPREENSSDGGSASGAGQFTPSAAGLRLLREDAARKYSASLEVGWWRTLPALGEFSPQDFITQAELVRPGGVGLLVYGSGVHWGTAYLGPDGHAPDTAGTLVTTTGAFPEPPPEPEPAAEPGPELVDITAGEHLTQEPIPLADSVETVKSTGLTAAAAGKPLRQQVKRRSSGRTRRRAPARGQARAPGQLTGGTPGPEIPEDVRLVVGAIAIVAVLAAIIVGILLHSLTATVIIAAIALLAIFSSVWLSRR
jgi:hypothetical protein